MRERLPVLDQAIGFRLHAGIDDSAATQARVERAVARAQRGEAEAQHIVNLRLIRG